MSDSHKKTERGDKSAKEKTEEGKQDHESDSYYYDDATGYEIYHDQEEEDLENLIGDESN